MQDNRHSESEMWKNETPPRQLIPYRKCLRSSIGPTLKASQDMVTGSLSWFRKNTLAGYKVIEQRQMKRLKAGLQRPLPPLQRPGIRIIPRSSSRRATNTLHRSDTGVVIERAVRREGITTTMVQRGLPEE